MSAKLGRMQTWITIEDGKIQRRSNRMIVDIGSARFTITGPLFFHGPYLSNQETCSHQLKYLMLNFWEPFPIKKKGEVTIRP